MAGSVISTDGAARTTPLSLIYVEQVGATPNSLVYVNGALATMSASAMTVVTPSGAAVLAGLGSALQTAFNGRIGAEAGTPITPTVLNFAEGVLALIVKSAFGVQQAAGGFAGYALSQAMMLGIKRGLFSNEAGMGSAPNAAAASIVGLVYPPTPMTRSARCREINRIDCQSPTGTESNPRTASPNPFPITGLAVMSSSGNPSCANTFVSMPFTVPTKMILVEGSRRRNSRAKATAGYKCPPVPPAAIRIVIRDRPRHGRPAARSPRAPPGDPAKYSTEFPPPAG